MSDNQLSKQVQGKSDFWEGKRVCVTGGAGFLGSFVVDKLKERNAADIFIPRKSEYNLVEKEAINDMLNDSNPDIIIHLAANVGGIGANLTHQANYFYDTLMMGTQLIHESYMAGIEKFVAIGTICAYPKFSPVPFKEDDLWNGYPEETNAPYGLAKKMMLVQSSDPPFNEAVSMHSMSSGRRISWYIGVACRASVSRIRRSEKTSLGWVMPYIVIGSCGK